MREIKLPMEEKKSTYFSLIIPEEDAKITKDQPIIVTNLKDLQPLLKRNIHARFRAFSSYEDAVSFMESPDNPEFGTPSKAQPNTRGRASLPNTPRPIEKRVAEERANNFPTPKPQDMALINSYITRRLNDQLMEAIKSNPRLLCTDCDVAPAVHEGTRLNALHASAKNNNSETARAILETISSISFFEMLYPKDDDNTRSDRCRHLSMSYLNTPDKMLLETPLHFAAKFNSTDVVKLLIFHPLCKLDAKNDQGLTPIEIAGSRTSGPNSIKEKKKVICLLQEVYIVPIWRDVLSASLRVGIYGKFHSFGNKFPKLRDEPFFNFPEELLPPFDESLIPFQHSRADEVEISSYAGPMTKEKAKEFYRLLKESAGRRVADSPCASPELNSGKKLFASPPMASPSGSPVKIMPGSPIVAKDLMLPSTPTKSISKQSKADMSMRMEDGVKGLERLCRKYAKDLQVPWKEHWKFLDTFCDLESRVGLELLDSFFLDKEQILDTSETSDDFNGTIESDNLIWSYNAQVNYEDVKLGDNVPVDIHCLTSQGNGIKLLIEGMGSMSIASPKPPIAEFYKPRRRYPLSSLPDHNDKLADGDVIQGSLQFSPREIKAAQMDINKMCWGYRDVTNNSINSTIASELDISADFLSDVSMGIKNDNEMEEDFDDRESFLTAASHEEMEEEEFEDCDTISVFIDGIQPKENDRQVFYAIKDIIDDDILNQYPAISRWYNSLKAESYVKTDDSGSIRWIASPSRMHMQSSPFVHQQRQDAKRALQFN